MSDYNLDLPKTPIKTDSIKSNESSNTKLSPPVNKEQLFNGTTNHIFQNMTHEELIKLFTELNEIMKKENAKTFKAPESEILPYYPDKEAPKAKILPYTPDKEAPKAKILPYSPDKEVPKAKILPYFPDRVAESEDKNADKITSSNGLIKTTFEGLKKTLGVLSPWGNILNPDNIKAGVKLLPPVSLADSFIKLVKADE